MVERTTPSTTQGCTNTNAGDCAMQNQSLKCGLDFGTAKWPYKCAWHQRNAVFGDTSNGKLYVVNASGIETPNANTKNRLDADQRMSKCQRSQTKKSCGIAQGRARCPDGNCTEEILTRSPQLSRAPLPPRSSAHSCKAIAPPYALP